MLHDDCSVVQRGVRVEDGHQQFRSDSGVEEDTAVCEFLQARLTFQNNECAVSPPGQDVTRLRDGSQRLFENSAAARRPAEQCPGPAQSFQCPAQLRLKDNGDSHEQCGESLLRQPAESAQACYAAQQGDQDDEEDHTTQ